MDDLVSVIIATYNRPTLLKRALRSVEKQTHKNLEVIIIDDCSKFSPEHIISQFKSLNIRYFRNKTNSKVAYSTNKGVKLAKGEYIALLGDDDEWTSKCKIENQLGCIKNSKKSNVGAVFTGFRYIDDFTKKEIESIYPNIGGNLLKKILVKNGILASTTVLMPSSVWQSIGGYNENITRGIDSDLFRRLLIANYNIVSINKIMANVYIGRKDRMGYGSSSESLEMHIRSEKYKLNRFKLIFEEYSFEKKEVYKKISKHEYKAWIFSRKNTYLINSTYHLFKSMPFTKGQYLNSAKTMLGRFYNILILCLTR
ncbi:MAG: hypothetical protein CMP73_05655 [Flavobacteriales bacterium]|nr:hypothetical protein [Flavobacteriales bacterium]|tara:strand:- start:30026 stop:30961 length:936 start_codon:yes stop_codon:yes gene_type:complete